jgi:spore coat protein CotH
LENLDWQATNWISVTALCDGRQFDKVGFRLKGHGSREGLRGKPNFTLKFNLEVKDQEFEGNTKVHFQNAALNASMLNEYLASWLFHRAGLPCPRVNFAHLTVNGVDYGILVVVEGTTKAFLRREFGEGEGLLFEGEYSDVNGRLDLDSGVIPPGYDGLQRLSEGAVQALQSGSDQLLTNCLNLPQFTRFTAAEIALGHVDGYAISANNYRFYQSTKDHRFQFIPHGMDRLALDHRSVTPVMKGILANVLLRLPAGRDAYFVGVKVFL